MTKIIRKTVAVLAAVAVAAGIFCMFPARAEASTYAYDDLIKYYGITAHVLDSGAVEMTYEIKWQVLHDSKGGVSWVKIGIANEDANKFERLTKNIKSVKYMSEGGSYAKVVFNREYKAGEVINFKFKFVQHNLFREGS